MAPERFDPAFAKQAAENYQRYLVPAIAAPVAARLVDAADPRPGERVLDVACGTGVVARLAAERVGEEGAVVGLDPSPGMIAVARETAEAGPAPVTWREAPAEAIPLEDESVDVVLCGMGLQFFQDRRAGLREMRRVLVPGGRLLANVPGPTPPPLEAMAGALARHVGPESAGFVEAVFSLHDEDEIRELAADAGFERVNVRVSEASLDLPAPREFLRQYARSTPLMPQMSALDDGEQEALESDFEEACEPFVRDGRLRGPVRLSTLVAVK